MFSKLFLVPPAFIIPDYFVLLYVSIRFELVITLRYSPVYLPGVSIPEHQSRRGYSTPTPLIAAGKIQLLWFECFPDRTNLFNPDKFNFKFGTIPAMHSMVVLDGRIIFQVADTI